MIVAAPAPTPVAPSALSDSLPFKIGEQLNYQVFIGSNNTPLGLASFQVRGRSRYFDRDGVYLTVYCANDRCCRALFVARDQIDSYVDPKALLPYRTVMNIVGRPTTSEPDTQHQSGQRSSPPVTKERGSRSRSALTTMFRSFMCCEHFNLTPKKRSAISVLVENKPKTMFVESQKRETIQLGGRSVPAISLSMTTDDPQPDKYQLRMWISDDSQRMPLRITCITKLGPLRADLAILPTTPQ